MNPLYSHLSLTINFNHPIGHVTFNQAQIHKALNYASYYSEDKRIFNMAFKDSHMHRIITTSSESRSYTLYRFDSNSEQLKYKNIFDDQFIESLPLFRNNSYVLYVFESGIDLKKEFKLGIQIVSKYWLPRMHELNDCKEIILTPETIDAHNKSDDADEKEFDSQTTEPISPGMEYNSPCIISSNNASDGSYNNNELEIEIM